MSAPATSLQDRRRLPSRRDWRVNAVASAALFGWHAWAAAQGAIAPEPAVAEPGLPRWEAGFAAGGGRVPDYPGSDRARMRGIVLPMFIYRGRVLRVDQQGIRSRLLSTPDWEFDLSATAAFNARNNEARAGMPGLDYLFGIGPQWVYKGWQTRGDGPTLHLKMRALMSTDFKRLDHRGFTVDPELRWRIARWPDTRSAISLSVQPTWASGALQRYFYAVEPSQATASRPAYAARAGYLGTDVGATWSSRPAGSVSWFVTARFTSLHGAANEASPLFMSRNNWSAGAGVVWTPWRSTQSAD